MRQVQVNLSMEDATRFYNQKRLGNLLLPNSYHDNPIGYITLQDLSANLSGLYEMIIDWRINKSTVNPNEVIAVIAFGSAVRYPGTTTVLKRKWPWSNPKPVEIPLSANDIDFLVITANNLSREEVLTPKLSGGGNYNGGPTTYLERTGIHLISRGSEQVRKGVQQGDTVSISALKEGVPVFFDDRFEELRQQTGIESETPRKLFWCENSDGILSGEIK